MLWACIKHTCLLDVNVSIIFCTTFRSGATFFCSGSVWRFFVVKSSCSMSLTVIYFIGSNVLTRNVSWPVTVAAVFVCWVLKRLESMSVALPPSAGQFHSVNYLPRPNPVAAFWNNWSLCISDFCHTCITAMCTPDYRYDNWYESIPASVCLDRSHAALRYFITWSVNRNVWTQTQFSYPLKWSSQLKRCLQWR